MILKKKHKNKKSKETKKWGEKVASPMLILTIFMIHNDEEDFNFKTFSSCFIYREQATRNSVEPTNQPTKKKKTATNDFALLWPDL